MATKTLSGGGNIYNYSDERRKKYEQESDRALQELAQKRQALQNPRTYASQYAKAITDYVNRGKFNYDFNADPIYNQYKDQYTRQGNLAMKDTMGQAAALTGGYGNSYAQTAGQQVYNQYMQNLNDIVPQLYESAYSRYNQEGQDMLNRASLLGEADNAEYQKLLQDYSIAADELNTAASLERAYAGDALAREQFEYQKAQDEIANQLAREQFEYQKSNKPTKYEPISYKDLTDDIKTNAMKLYSLWQSNPTQENEDKFMDYLMELDARGYDTLELDDYINANYKKGVTTPANLNMQGGSGGRIANHPDTRLTY